MARQIELGSTVYFLDREFECIQGKVHSAEFNLNDLPAYATLNVTHGDPLTSTKLNHNQLFHSSDAAYKHAITTMLDKVFGNVLERISL